MLIKKDIKVAETVRTAKLPAEFFVGAEDLLKSGRVWDAGKISLFASKINNLEIIFEEGFGVV